MEYKSDVKYLKSHEWAKQKGDEIVCGISDYAQDELSDVVYVEMPEVGATFGKGDIFGVVESVKAASDLYMPMGGEITAVNEKLEDAPELINESPFGEGWMIRFRPSNASEWDELLDVDAYKQAVAEEDH